MPKHHSINYIEFVAEDLLAIKDFYSKAFGWVFTDWGQEYVAFSDGTLDGGFAKGIPRGEEEPLVIIFSDALEVSLEAVKTCGGTIVKEIYSFPGGRRFHFKDPAGNQLAIWSDK
jgi:uncharacterized protein